MKLNKPHFHVTGGVIWKDSRLLITKRPQGTHLAGLWEFPGGKQERGETLEECLKREIKEELGMDVKVDGLFETVQHEYENKLITLHFFNCTHLMGRPKPFEGQDLKWVLPGDLSKYAFPPPDSQILKKLAPLAQP